MAHNDALLLDVCDCACRLRGVDIVASTSWAEQVVDLCTTQDADVLITAAVLDDGPIEPHLKRLIRSGIPFVLITEDSSAPEVDLILARGASGCVMYDLSPDQVVDVAVTVARGGVVLHPAVASRVLSQWRRLRAAQRGSAQRAELTPREREVFEAMAEGLAAKAIARRLGVAVKTVENHKIRIFDKLGVRSQAQAVSLAMSQGVANGDTIDGEQLDDL